MNARWFLVAALAAMAGSVVVGCGEAPSAKFALSDRTKKLDRPARTAVEGELAQGFGDPNRLVVWRKLPVDFGEFEGVVEQAGQGVGDPLQVRLTRKSPSVVPFKLDELKGAGIVWTSGSNSDVVAEVKGKKVPIDFQIDRFDPANNQLRMRVIPAEFAGSLAAPKKGDKFSVVGPVLQHGRKLYMTHCLHCHGVSGDGAGPTAAYFDIKPRDYRPGIFKFTSTRNTDRARRDDLARTILHGIPGTYMPSFLLFTDEEIGAIVEYVRWLAFRGQFEQKVDVRLEDFTIEAVNQRKKGGETQEQIDKGLANFLHDEMPGVVGEAGDDLATAWTAAEQPDSQVVPKMHRTPDSPQSRERGRKLFFSDVAKCAQCHGPAGRGDGPQTEDYQTILGSTKKYDKPGLYDEWGHPIKPRDLTSGIYRGGRRPVDIYRRIYAGIKGTPMPPFGTALKEEEIWDLVNYAMSLPYQKGSEYPEPPRQSKIASASDSTSHRVGEN